MSGKEKEYLHEIRASRAHGGAERLRARGSTKSVVVLRPFFLKMVKEEFCEILLFWRSTV